MRLIASLSALALVAGLAVIPQSSAQADLFVPSLVITPTSGNVNTDTVFISSIAANAGIDTAVAGATYVFQNGVNLGPISAVRTPSTPASYGTFGFDGISGFADRSLQPTNPYVSDRLLNALDTPLATGDFELRYYWFAASTPDFDNDGYVDLPMTYSAMTGEWSVLPPIIATTVSLTASASGTSVTLSATVKNADTGLAEPGATGTMTYREGVNVVATTPVIGGVSTSTLTSVALGDHTYTAEFTPAGLYTYFESTSAPATVTVTGGTPGGNIDVTIPTGVGNLYLTSASSSVPLGTAVKSGGVLTASGTLTAVVTDERQLDYPQWNLTGQVGNFTKPGGAVLDGKYLGWVPSVAGGSIGTPGPAVLSAPTTAAGLTTPRLLAAGSPSTAGTVTTALALLQLRAPVQTPAGSYSATLTLTLI